MEWNVTKINFLPFFESSHFISSNLLRSENFDDVGLLNF